MRLPARAPNPLARRLASLSLVSLQLDDRSHLHLCKRRRFSTAELATDPPADRAPWTGPRTRQEKQRPETRYSDELPDRVVTAAPKRANEQQAAQGKDEINTLLRHPALYEPVLAPRFPLVLCHGLYGFDVRGPAFFRLHYWGEVLNILKNVIKANVIVTAVPGTGSVKNRAETLHASLNAMESLRGQEINFLAHSMGGLDARYLLTHIRPTFYNPLSLTSVCTPHRGSEFMEWCRANIGIGTDEQATALAVAAAKTELEYEELRQAQIALQIPVPYSLKSPILTRNSLDAEAQGREAEATKESKPSALSATAKLSSSTLTKYLLDLLDSPAYANLTPSFLQRTFNPATPNMPHIRYFSVAARTPSIPIWHPLWLPKTVLDGAAEARAAKGIVPPKGMEGNDGLVGVESAKWGEFLGIVENCDHWEARGSSGLIKAAAEGAKAAAEEKGKGDPKASKGWGWQDLYALINSSLRLSSDTATPTDMKDLKEKTPKVNPREMAQNEERTGMTALAGWVLETLPNGITGGDDKEKSYQGRATSPSNSEQTAQDSGLLHSSSNPQNLPQDVQASRRLYGMAGSESAKKDELKFNLERTTLAICRKLHQEGL